MDLKKTAAANLAALANNSYPGRGIVVGMDSTARYLVEAYWIMGRSENSRNRLFGYKEGRLFTEAADPSKVENPELLIYNAMNEQDGFFIVSNGDQTDTIVATVKKGKGFYEAMCSQIYEPDSPNFTPRIAAVCVRGAKHVAEMAILRRSPFGDTCDRYFYRFDDLAPGFGFCLTTYTGDGEPLPAFQGEPYLLPLEGGLQDIVETFWGALNPDNRISLAVKFIPRTSGKSQTGIMNRFSKA